MSNKCKVVGFPVDLEVYDPERQMKKILIRDISSNLMNLSIDTLQVLHDDQRLQIDEMREQQNQEANQ